MDGKPENTNTPPTGIKLLRIGELAQAVGRSTGWINQQIQAGKFPEATYRSERRGDRMWAEAYIRAWQEAGCPDCRTWRASNRGDLYHE